MLKVLVNTASINDGGNLQVAINFIKNTLQNANNIEWYYIVSKRIFYFLNLNDIFLPEEKHVVVRTRPSDVKYRKEISREILNFESSKKIDIVYSLGSPSYISFKSIEIQRLTNPYIINPNKYAYNTFPFISRIKRYLITYVQRYEIRNCKYFITQTALAKSHIIKRFNIVQDNVFVISNALADCFLSMPDNANKEKLENIIFCLSAPNPHKNIDKVPLVAYLLKQKMPEVKFKFLLTVENEHPIYKAVLKKAKALNVENSIENVGKLTQEECVNVFLKSKVTFLPTYLEVFSATLIESMKMRVPIVTTNFDFNKTITEDAALYFNPNDWKTASNALCNMLVNENIRQEFIKKGDQIITKFPSASEVYYSTCEIIKNISGK